MAESRRRRTEEDSTRKEEEKCTAHFTQAAPCYMFQYSSCSSLALPRHMTIPILHRIRTSFFPLHCDQKPLRRLQLASRSTTSFIIFIFFLSFSASNHSHSHSHSHSHPPRPRSYCSLPTPSLPPSSRSRLNFIDASGLRGGESEF